MVMKRTVNANAPEVVKTTKKPKKKKMDVEAWNRLDEPEEDNSKRKEQEMQTSGRIRRLFVYVQKTLFCCLYIHLSIFFLLTF